MRTSYWNRPQSTIFRLCAARLKVSATLASPRGVSSVLPSLLFSGSFQLMTKSTSFLGASRYSAKWIRTLSSG